VVFTGLVTVYAIMVGIFQPWIMPGLNSFEIIATMLLALLGTVGLIFNSFVKERGLLVQLDDAWAKDAVDALDKDLKMFAVFILAIMGAFTCLFLGLVIWCLSSLPAGRVAQTVRAQTARQETLQKKMRQVVESNDFFLLLEAVIVQGTEYDRQRLDEFLRKIAAVAFQEPGKVDKAFIRPPSKHHEGEMKPCTKNGSSVVSA